MWKITTPLFVSSMRKVRAYLEMIEVQAQIANAVWKGDSIEDASSVKEITEGGGRLPKKDGKLIERYGGIEQALKTRQDRAHDVIRVWNVFVEQLGTKPSIQPTLAPLAALCLNDSVYTHARQYASDQVLFQRQVWTHNDKGSLLRVSHRKRKLKPPKSRSPSFDGRTTLCRFRSRRSSGRICY